MTKRTIDEANAIFASYKAKAKAKDDKIAYSGRPLLLSGHDSHSRTTARNQEAAKKGAALVIGKRETMTCKLASPLPKLPNLELRRTIKV